MCSQISIIMEGNVLMCQTRDKVEFTNKTNNFNRRNLSWEQVQHVPCPIWSYQKPWLMPQLTAFLTQSLSRGLCKAVTTAQVGLAFLGSALAGLWLWAKPCTSLTLIPGNATSRAAYELCNILLSPNDVYHHLGHWYFFFFSTLFVFWIN